MSYGIMHINQKPLQDCIPMKLAYKPDSLQDSEPVYALYPGNNKHKSRLGGQSQRLPPDQAWDKQFLNGQHSGRKRGTQDRNVQHRFRQPDLIAPPHVRSPSPSLLQLWNWK